MFNMILFTTAKTWEEPKCPTEMKRYAAVYFDIHKNTCKMHTHRELLNHKGEENLTL